MTISLKCALVAGLAVGGMGFAAAPASALPMSGIDPAIATSTDLGQATQNVRWLCGPYGCHWVPGYGYWGPRPWGPRPWGYHRGWGYGGYHHGWHRHW